MQAKFDLARRVYAFVKNPLTVLSWIISFSLNFGRFFTASGELIIILPYLRNESFNTSLCFIQLPDTYFVNFFDNGPHGPKHLSYN